MFSVSFWKDSAERAVKTFAQALSALLVASSTTLIDTDWKAALATAGMTTLLSVLTSLASAAKTAKVDGEEPVRTASLLDGVKYDETA